MGNAPLPVGGVDDAVICGETGGYWNAVFFAKLYSEPKTALNKKKNKKICIFKKIMYFPLRSVSSSWLQVLLWRPPFKQIFVIFSFPS